MGESTVTSRRAFLKAGGVFVVSIGMAVSLDSVLAVGSAYAQGARPPLLPTELASYLAIDADGGVSVYFGKTDTAQGLYAAIAQIVAEELDVEYEKVTVFMGDTATTLNQGGASGSTGVQLGGKQMRAAAAEARRVLVEMAAASLGLPADQLDVADGLVHAKDNPKKSVTYAALIGGKYFNVQLDWNKQIGNTLYAPGKAQPKPVSAYKIVGKPLKRTDIAPKVFAREDYVTDVKVPGMMHARVIRPPVAGASPATVDENPIKDIPGARIVRQNAFLAVVAETEWGAVQAAQTLKVEWTAAKPPFVDVAAIYDHIRAAPVQKRETDKEVGNIDVAFPQAASVIEAEYEWPFQSHSSMGPGCGIVEIKGDKATVWTGSPKPHFCRDGVAAILGLPPENVHGISLSGSGSYGRNDAGDAAIEAAIIAKAVGRAVRLQYMRGDGTGWDPKGPASVHRVRAGIDKDGKVIAYEFATKGFSRVDVSFEESKPRNTLGGQLIGVPVESGHGFGHPLNSYQFDNTRMSWETIAPLLERGSPLRTSHLRDPVGPQIHFAHESFIDELAAALNADPVEFRLRYLTDPRDIAVTKAVAEKAGWQPRKSPRGQSPGDTLSGRGIAYTARGDTRVAIVADVNVSRSSGRVWVRKVTVAHDCGLIVNPNGLRHTIEGNVIHGISRTLLEEVTFDPKNVTSVDWATYPILDIGEMPEAIDIVLIDHPEIASSGAGEPSIRPMAAAIGNAVFDATGVRLRRAPFLPERVKPLLS
jgi:nicotinate dehydrogenase subunit B